MRLPCIILPMLLLSGAATAAERPFDGRWGFDAEACAAEVLVADSSTGCKGMPRPPGGIEPDDRLYANDLGSGQPYVKPAPRAND